MCAQLNLQSKNEKLYVPEKATITKIARFTATEKFFALELANGRSLGHDPGQFVQVSIFGIGEAPISISSPPSSDNTFEMCVRAVGDVTNKLHALNEGDKIYIRGPFGHGFDQEIMDRMQGKHLLFIGGGIGYVPLRSLINKVVKETENYARVSILFGCKRPEERLYVNELQALAKMGGKVEFLETVDRATNGWKGNVGVITTLIPKVEFDPQNTIAVIVGPPIMYKFVLISLMDRKVPNENIYMSLERRMKCGVGKCGHCQMEGIYVCQEGPVFNYAEVKENKEVL
jgi:sulfhydrogenase subunit gamma (sulfur reductase)